MPSKKKIRQNINTARQLTESPITSKAEFIVDSSYVKRKTLDIKKLFILASYFLPDFICVSERGKVSVCMLAYFEIQEFSVFYVNILGFFLLKNLPSLNIHVIQLYIVIFITCLESSFTFPALTDLNSM